MQRNPFLVDRPFLSFDPVFATIPAIGLNGAIFLQHLHYWIVRYEGDPDRTVDGRTWIYNSTEAWAARFPFWSTRTIARVITQLREAGILLTRNDLNRDRFDRTTWFTIDYDRLRDVTDAVPPIGENDAANLAGSDAANLAGSDAANLAGSYKEQSRLQNQQQNRQKRGHSPKPGNAVGETLPLDPDLFEEGRDGANAPSRVGVFDLLEAIADIGGWDRKVFANEVWKRKQLGALKRLRAKWDDDAILRTVTILAEQKWRTGWDVTTVAGAIDGMAAHGFTDRQGTTGKTSRRSGRGSTFRIGSEVEQRARRNTDDVGDDPAEFVDRIERYRLPTDPA